MGGFYCIRAFMRGQVNLGLYQVCSTCICITFLNPAELFCVANPPMGYSVLIKLKNSYYF